MADRQGAGRAPWRRRRKPPADRLRAGEFSRTTESGADDDTDSGGPNLRARRQALRRGARGEGWAAFALMLKGYRIVARRYKTGLGEIDLIARRGDLVLIVEVKARSTLTEAMEAIARQSERRIEAAADLWLARQPDHARLRLRFDMVAVLPRRWPVHVPAIFEGRN